LLLFSPLATKAHLVDLTPGGFTDFRPDLILRLNQEVFFDSARPNGWVSRFGRLNGADWFETNLFTIGDSPFASISWDLTGQPDGFWLNFVTVFGITEDGVGWSNFYRTSPDQRFIGEGIVTLNGIVAIDQIAFYGRNRAPDTGPTLLLFGLALAAVLFANRWRLI
jgi:hypothetical protein